MMTVTVEYPVTSVNNKISD